MTATKFNFWYRQGRLDFAAGKPISTFDSDHPDFRDSSREAYEKGWKDQQAANPTSTLPSENWTIREFRHA